MSYSYHERSGSFLATVLRHITQSMALFVTLLLAACGGSSSSNSDGMGSVSAQSCNGCGTALLTLTDAPGDFLTYTVNVTSLTLNRADGTTVQTVPASTTVDFAQLVNLSEVISAQDVPAANYVSASMTFDYTSSNIVVDNGTASGLAVTAVDSNGAPLTQLTLTVTLDANNTLLVTPRTIANLALDFNLLASNTVNTSTATVTVSPVLTASLVPDAAKQLLVRGPLASVNVTNSSYSVNVNPFFSSGGTRGQVVVNTTTTTMFNINGVAYTGSAGLAQLNMLAAGTPTLADGTLSTTDHSFTATNVVAGSSLMNTKLDRIEGTVIARTGNVLTVRGAFWNSPDDDFHSFQRHDVMVTVGSSTAVTEDGQMGNFSIADISVGQHAVFFGVANVVGMSGASSSASSTSSTSSSSSSASSSSSSAMIAPGGIGVLTLDATSGNVCLEPTWAWGTVNATASNSVTINLQALDARMPSEFNFAGTGTSDAMDASAAAYVIDTGTLGLSGVTANTPVRLIGFVAPFGMAPPDFNAGTLVNYAQTNAIALVRWNKQGNIMPFATMNSSTLSIAQNTLDGSVQPFVRVGPELINLLSSAAHTTGLTLSAPTSGTANRYGIAHASSRKIDNFAMYADFEAALQMDLNGTVAALAVEASGPYDSATATLQSAQAIVILND